MCVWVFGVFDQLLVLPLGHLAAASLETAKGFMGLVLLLHKLRTARIEFIGSFPCMMA